MSIGITGMDATKEAVSPFRLGLLSNMWVIYGSLLMIALQFCVTHIPLFNAIFETTPLNTWEWLKIAGVSLLVFLIIEAEKILRRGRKNKL
ncbi:MAG: cation transporting ATPase C-terminal domain-containing protein [Bdellovibrionales bacterium]